MNNAEKIQQWRDEHPNARVTEQVLLDILGIGSLEHADLTGANLQNAFLSGADLTEANLTDANLREADLWGANLKHANLKHANLWRTSLWRANLRSANLKYANLHNNRAGILTVDGAHPYRVTLVPTLDGWVLVIGCWHGTIDELRALISQDEGWPEATGEEIETRRPILENIAGLCDLHIGRHAGLIDDLAKRWNL